MYNAGLMSVTAIDMWFRKFDLHYGDREQYRELLHVSVVTIISSKGKGEFLYSAVSKSRDCSKRLTLYFPDRPVQSHTISTSLGNIQPYATINARRLRVHISTTVYSQVLIYTAE